MRRAFLTALAVVLVPSIPACSAQTAGPYELVSHCDFYDSPRSLSEILVGGESAFLASQIFGKGTKVLGPARYKVMKTYFGDIPEEITLLQASPSDYAAANEYILSRYESHVSPAFFWNSASRPDVYGFSGSDRDNCELIPVSLPEQLYLVVMEEGKVTMFEPVPEGTSALKEWLEYYSEEVLPFTER